MFFVHNSAQAYGTPPDIDDILRQVVPPQSVGGNALIPPEWSMASNTYQTLAHPNGRARVFVAIGRLNLSRCHLSRNHTVSNPAVLAITPLRELDADALSILRGGPPVAADIVQSESEFDSRSLKRSTC